MNDANSLTVLVVIDSLRNAGAERSLAAVAPEYATRGVTLHVVCLRPRFELAEGLEAAGAVVHRHLARLGRARQLVGLVRLIRRVRPDVVHTTLFEADVLGRSAALLTRTPAMTSWVGATYSAAHRSVSTDGPVMRIKRRAAQLLDRLTLRPSTTIHAVSESVATSVSRALRLDFTRITVIARGRPLPQGEPGSPVAPPQVLMLARHEHVKGIDVFLRAMAEPILAGKDLRAVVAGESGAHTAALRTLARSLGFDPDEVLIGPRPAVDQLLADATLVVIASRSEGFPGVAVEAMLHQRPLIVTDVAGTREVVGDTALAVVPVGDHIALASAIAAALASPRRRELVARRAFARANQRFTITTTAAAMVELTRQAARVRTARRR
jgi:glycosyltransferase involved in cell wall biosynthesis